MILIVMEKTLFLLAIDTNNDKIIGTIEVGPASTLINSCTGGVLKDLYEIGTVFILPEYQKGYREFPTTYNVSYVT